MSWDVIAKFLGPAGAVLNMALAWVLWSLRQSFVLKRDFNRLENRVKSIDSELRHLPSAAALTALTVRMETLNGDCRELGARLKGLEGVLTRIEKPLDLLMQHQIESSK